MTPAPAPALGPGLFERRHGPGSLGLKQLIKNSVYGSIGAGSKYSGLTWLRHRVGHTECSLRILMYHKVNRLPGNTLSVSPERLGAQLDFLLKHYAVVSPAQVWAAAQDGDRLPPGAVMLTFDDGYHDNYEHAYPILKNRGLQALLFVATDFIGSRTPLPHDVRLGVVNPTLDWDELAEMADVFTVGSHGRSHRVLTQLPLDEALSEIEVSKAVITERLGVPVRFFSYPKGAPGDFDEVLEQGVRTAGYGMTFVTVSGANTWEHVRSATWMKRYNVEPFSDFTFARLLDGSCDLVGIKETPWGQRGKRLLNRALGTVAS